MGGAGGLTLSDDPGTRAYQIHCYMCHGEQGAGTPLAPETQHPVRDYSTWVVRNGLPGEGYLKPMEAIPPAMLSDADLMLIYDYLDKPPQPTTAQGLYADYCGNCHGADGKGGPSTRDITGDAVDPIEEVVRQGTHPGEFELRNEYMPPYSTTRISDAELQLVSDYVDTL
jgi:mono/diheme cytochrome c family protein